MRKSYALLTSLIVALLLASSMYVVSTVKQNTRESITVARVIDGDTLETTDGRIIRLANVNTPEKGKYGYTEAKSFLARYQDKELQAVIQGTDNRGERYVGKLYTPDNIYLNLELVRQGLSSKAWVEESEIQEFVAAEKEAIASKRGLWKPSPDAPCITARVEPEKEIAVIKNTCPDLSLNGWWLKDESRELYVFSINQATTLTLHSEKGTNTRNDLYWGKSQHIWNDDRDTLYLFDNENRVVSVYMYGY